MCEPWPVSDARRGRLLFTCRSGRYGKQVVEEALNRAHAPSLPRGPSLDADALTASIAHDQPAALRHHHHASTCLRMLDGILPISLGSRNSAANPSRRQPRLGCYLAVAALYRNKEFHPGGQVDLNERTRGDCIA